LFKAKTAKIGLNHNLPQFFLFKVDMSPLQRHDIHDAKPTRMKGKEEHFKKLFTPKFCACFIIVKQLRHLFIGQTFTIKLGFFKTLVVLLRICLFQVYSSSTGYALSRSGCLGTRSLNFPSG
jgi:hypothetical protein